MLENYKLLYRHREDGGLWYVVDRVPKEKRVQIADATFEYDGRLVTSEEFINSYHPAWMDLSKRLIAKSKGKFKVFGTMVDSKGSIFHSVLDKHSDENYMVKRETLASWLKERGI